MRKLYLSDNDKLISGVCGGVTEYLKENEIIDVDSTIIRLLWAGTCLLWGTGIIAYILCAIIIPKRTD
ncbi:MAG: PspC domain-containing protein [Clostridiaceae bacterium]